MILRKIKYGVFVCFMGVLVAMLYLSLIGLPNFLARNIEKRLQFQGLVVTLEKVKLGVFEGIIATRVRCYRKGDIGVPLLEVEKIILRLHPVDWLRGHNGVTGAIVKNGAVSVPIQGSVLEGAAPRPNRFAFEVLSARVSWDAGRSGNGAGGVDTAKRIRVEECAAQMPGIKLTGRGELVLPRESGGATPSPAAEGSAPSADSGAPGKVRLVELLEAWQRCGLSTNGSGAVNVDVTCFLDAADIGTRDIQVQADARRTCYQKTVIGAWRLTLSLKGTSGDGALDFADAMIEGAAVGKGSVRFRFDESSVTLQSLEATVGKDSWRGPLHLSGLFDWTPRQFRGAMKSAFNPHALLPLLYALGLSEANCIEWFQFMQQPPNVKADITGGLGTQAFLHVTGYVQADSCQFHGVTNLLMKTDLVADFSPTNASLALAPLLVVREEGTVRAGARVDFKHQTVSFNGLSTADPKAVAAMLDPSVEAIVNLFQFDGPTRVAAWGTAGCGDVMRHDMDIDVDVQRSGLKALMMDRCSLGVRVAADTIYVNDVQADFCRGLLSGAGEIYPVLDVANKRYHLEGNVHEVNFQMLMRNVTGQWADRYKGRLSGQLKLDGFLGDSGGSTATGQGWVKISEGRLFQIPLFGGLTEFLGRVVPGLSLLMRQTDARATFVIKDGKIHSDNIVIEGEVVSLTGKGDYHWNGDLDFAVQVKLLKSNSLVGGIVQIAMLPVTKMLEFRLTGTVKEPRWRPAYLPKEMFLIFD